MCHDDPDRAAPNATEVYVAITCIGRHITDLEIFNTCPTFPPPIAAQGSVESDNHSFVRLFHGWVNGGDSMELHFNYETWRWEA